MLDDEVLFLFSKKVTMILSKHANCIQGMVIKKNGILKKAVASENRSNKKKKRIFEISMRLSSLAIFSVGEYN